MDTGLLSRTCRRKKLLKIIGFQDHSRLDNFEEYLKKHPWESLLSSILEKLIAIYQESSSERLLLYCLDIRIK